MSDILEREGRRMIQQGHLDAGKRTIALARRLAAEEKLPPHLSENDMLHKTIVIDGHTLLSQIPDRITRPPSETISLWSSARGVDMSGIAFISKNSAAEALGISPHTLAAGLGPDDFTAHNLATGETLSIAPGTPSHTMTLGLVVRAWRELRGVEQAEMAVKLNELKGLGKPIPRNTYWGHERRNYPLKNVTVTATLLGVPETFLLNYITPGDVRRALQK